MFKSQNHLNLCIILTLEFCSSNVQCMFAWVVGWLVGCGVKSHVFWANLFERVNTTHWQIIVHLMPLFSHSLYWGSPRLYRQQSRARPGFLHSGSVGWALLSGTPQATLESIFEDAGCFCTHMDAQIVPSAQPSTHHRLLNDLLGSRNEATLVGLSEWSEILGSHIPGKPGLGTYQTCQTKERVWLSQPEPLP